MDFYYAMTNYQLLECIIHRMNLNNHKGEKVIYVSSFLLNNQSKLLKNLKDSCLFDKVEIYEETIFSHDKGINISKEIKRISNDVEKKYGKVIKKAQNIYIAQDAYALGVYLVDKGINYYYFEDACGAYTNSEILFNIIKKENINRNIIMKKLKLAGQSKYVLKVFCDLECQKKELINNKCTDLSIKKELKKMTSNKIQKLLKIYGYNSKKYNKTSSKKDLLLTWHYNNMRMMTLKEQYLFFTTLADYFHDYNKQLYIKPHPSDIQAKYKNIFKDATILEPFLPSELLPYCTDDKYDVAITNWSTSIYGLKTSINQIINFDKRIDNSYIYFDKYYAIVMYLKHNKSKDIKHLFFYEINEIQLVRMLEYYFKDYKKYYIIDENDKSNEETIYIMNKIDNNTVDKKVIELNGSISTNNIYIERKLKNKKKEITYIGLYNLDDNIEFMEEKMLKYSKYSLKISLKNSVDLVNYLYKEFNHSNTKNEKIIQEKNKIIDLQQESLQKYQARTSEMEENNKDLIKKMNQQMEEIHNTTSWKITKPIRIIADLIRKVS